MLPLDLVSELTFVPCRKSYTNAKMIEMLMKLIKRSKSLKLDLMDFVKSIGGSNEIESQVLKLGACIGRARGFSNLDPSFIHWVIHEVSTRDPKIPKTSTRNIQLAKQLTREIQTKIVKA
jgi:hypothetical protein